jgi:hypothetical protein
MITPVSLNNNLWDSLEIMNRIQRAFLHFRCLCLNPKQWKFYWAGIWREITKK